MELCRYLKQDDVAGATIAVVKDGKVLFARSYGYADVKQKRPVSAEQTLFRPGSVSKLFTWTAVMQLFEKECSTWTATLMSTLISKSLMHLESRSH